MLDHYLTIFLTSLSHRIFLSHSLFPFLFGPFSHFLSIFLIGTLSHYLSQFTTLVLYRSLCQPLSVSPSVALAYILSQSHCFNVRSFSLSSYLSINVDGLTLSISYLTVVMLSVLRFILCIRHSLKDFLTLLSHSHSNTIRSLS